MAFQIDTIAPTTLISDPADMTWVTGAIDVSGVSSDLHLDGAEILTDGGSSWSGLGLQPDGSWSTTWDTQTVANGSHSVQARARDQAGNVGGAAAVTIMVDNGVPQIGIPASWPIWRRVSINVVDNGIGVDRVRLTIHGGEYGDRVYNWSSGPDDFKWDRHFEDIVAPIGGYPVEVEAWDKAGNKGAAWGEIVIPEPDEVDEEDEEDSAALSVEPPEKPSEPPSNSGGEEPVPMPTNTPEPPRVVVFGGESGGVQETTDEEIAPPSGSSNLLAGAAAVAAVGSAMAVVVAARKKRKDEEKKKAAAASMFNKKQIALEKERAQKAAQRKWEEEQAKAALEAQIIQESLDGIVERGAAAEAAMQTDEQPIIYESETTSAPRGILAVAGESVRRLINKAKSISTPTPTTTATLHIPTVTRSSPDPTATYPYPTPTLGGSSTPTPSETPTPAASSATPSATWFPPNYTSTPRPSPVPAPTKVARGKIGANFIRKAAAQTGLSVLGRSWPRSYQSFGLISAALSGVGLAREIGGASDGELKGWSIASKSADAGWSIALAHEGARVAQASTSIGGRVTSELSAIGERVIVEVAGHPYIQSGLRVLQGVGSVGGVFAGGFQINSGVQRVREGGSVAIGGLDMFGGLSTVAGSGITLAGLAFGNAVPVAALGLAPVLLGVGAITGAGVLAYDLLKDTPVVAAANQSVETWANQPGGFSDRAVEVGNTLREAGVPDGLAAAGGIASSVVHEVTHFTQNVAEKVADGVTGFFEGLFGK